MSINTKKSLYIEKMLNDSQNYMIIHETSESMSENTD